MPAHRAKTERGVIQLPSGWWQYYFRVKGRTARGRFNPENDPIEVPATSIQFKYKIVWAREK